MSGEKTHLITASPAPFQSTDTRVKRRDEQKWLKGLDNAFARKDADF